MIRLLLLIGTITLASSAMGCASRVVCYFPSTEPMAYRTDSPIVIDGKLTEADWQNAQRFSLGRSKQDDAKEPHDIEPGWVMRQRAA